jgi:Holliday junction DNA helicase RuvB
MDDNEYRKQIHVQYIIGRLEHNGNYSWGDAEYAVNKKGILPAKSLPKDITQVKKSHIFIPQNFTQYIGQYKAKEILQNYVDATKERKTQFPHTIIYGKAGMGKTTLAKIVGKLLKKNVVVAISSSVDLEKIVDIITKLKGNILFLDEVHALERSTVEGIYQMMEEFSYNGENITPFTLIAATTEIGEIIKDRKPFYDRFKIRIELEDYEAGDLVKIGTQFKNNTFKKDKLPPKIYREIAENSRLTPRTMIRLTEAVVYFNGDVRKVLKNFSILYRGYTEKDLKILEYLAKQKTVGIQGLTSYLDTSLPNYMYEIEPYLVKTEVIVRTPRGRAISEQGKRLLKLLRKRG